MGTKQQETWKDRFLQKNNTGTYTVSIPINMIRDLRWQQGQRVRIRREGKKIIIEDAPPQ
jgi:hypothetical protein